MSRRRVFVAEELEYAAAGDLAWIIANRRWPRWPRRQLLIEVNRDELLSWARMVIDMEQSPTAEQPKRADALEDGWSAARRDPATQAMLARLGWTQPAGGAQ